MHKQKTKSLAFINKYTLWTFFRAIGQMSRIFTNGPGGRGSIPDCVIPKTQKMALDDAFLNTHHYKVRIDGLKWSNPGKGVVSVLMCESAYIYIYILTYI